MENSTIALIVWIVVCIAMAVFYIWSMVRDSGDIPFHLMHFTAPVPPPPANTWSQKAEMKDNGPWFLVVYEDTGERKYRIFAVEEVLQIRFNCSSGDIIVYYKNNMGFADNEMYVESIDHYKFLQASQLGDYRDV